jgi:hypothetical protein
VLKSWSPLCLGVPCLCPWWCFFCSCSLAPGACAVAAQAGFGVQDLEFRVQGLGFMVAHVLLQNRQYRSGLGFRV